MGSLILIRHGQASFGKKNYDKLSELGHLQARLLGKFFKEEGFTFDKFFSGNMSRQLETLREITQDTEPNILKGLNAANSLQSKLTVPNMEFSHIEIEIGVVPTIKLRYRQLLQSESSALPSSEQE